MKNGNGCRNRYPGWLPSTEGSPKGSRRTGKLSTFSSSVILIRGGQGISVLAAIVGLGLEVLDVTCHRK